MRHKKRLILLAGLLTLCGGCWDVNEIDDRALVLALGFDATTEGKVLTSAQIPVLTDLAGRTEGQAPEKPFIIRTGEADTVFGAVPGLQSKTSRNLFLGQLKTVVISTAIAKRGLRQFVDFLKRHPEIPPQVEMLVTEGNARDILDSPLSSKEIPGLVVRNFIESASKADTVYSLRLSQITRAFIVGPEDAYMPIISYNSREKSFIITGLAVFQNDRMVGELDDIETRMFGFLTGKAKNAYPSILMGREGIATFRDVSCRTKIRIVTSGNRIRCIIKARAQGFLTDLTNAKANFSLKDIQEIESRAAHEITNGMVRTMRRLQEMNADILGLGELLRATKPERWKSINWEKEFPLADFRIDFKFKIQRTGIYK